MRLTLLAALLFSVSAMAQDAPLTLVTADIDNFWAAIDDAHPDSLQRLYFDRGSAGLADFLNLRIGSAANLAATVERLPKFYASVRKNTLRVNTQKELMQLYASRFKGLYPATIFPPVYFLIGRATADGLRRGAARCPVYAVRQRRGRNSGCGGQVVLQL